MLFKFQKPNSYHACMRSKQGRGADGGAATQQDMKNETALICVQLSRLQLQILVGPVHQAQQWLADWVGQGSRQQGRVVLSRLSRARALPRRSRAGERDRQPLGPRAWRRRPARRRAGTSSTSPSFPRGRIATKVSTFPFLLPYPACSRGFACSLPAPCFISPAAEAGPRFPSYALPSFSVLKQACRLCFALILFPPTPKPQPNWWVGCCTALWLGFPPFCNSSTSVRFIWPAPIDLPALHALGIHLVSSRHGCFNHPALQRGLYFVMLSCHLSAATALPCAYPFSALFASLDTPTLI